MTTPQTDQHQHAGHEHGPAGHAHADHEGMGDMTDLLDLDVQVLHDYWTSALDWVRDRAAGSAPARVLDLGAGTGSAAIGLAGRFPQAQVAAVDIEDSSLRVLRERAAVYGLAPRVRALRANLDDGWPELGWPVPGPLDLTWASMSLHHMADPGAVLRDALAATAAGGLIAVAEFPEPLRFLPRDLGPGQAGFEERVTAGLGQAHAELMPTLGSAWAPRLAEAGWQVTAEREFAIDLDHPDHPRAGAYARGWFTRLSFGLTDRLEPADKAVLAELLDDHGPHALLRRTDLHIRGSRIVTLARKG